MGMKEAEAVKLFANTYLALRDVYKRQLFINVEMIPLACVATPPAALKATPKYLFIKILIPCWRTANVRCV